MENFALKSIREDKITTSDPGFHWVGHGRGANIYFVEKDSIVIVYAEMSAVPTYDVLIFGETEHIKERYYPDSGKIEELDIEERFRIQGLLVEWLKIKGTRHDIQIGK